MRRSTAICFCWLFIGSTVGADVLVTRDGGEIKTRGAWKIKGATVVFTLPNGTLSSIRLDEIDLDKSAVATAREQVPAPPPPALEPGQKPEKKAPVMVITDRDVRKADASPSSSSAAAALRVNEWQIETLEGDPAFALVGEVTNGGETSVGNVEITATLWAPDRSSSMAVLAQLEKPTLNPGETSRFRVDFSRQRVESSGFAAAFGQAQVELAIKAQTLSEQEPQEPVEEEREPEEGEAEAETVK